MILKCAKIEKIPVSQKLHEIIGSFMYFKLYVNIQCGLWLNFYNLSCPKYKCSVKRLRTYIFLTKVILNKNVCAAVKMLGIPKDV